MKAVFLEHRDKAIVPLAYLNECHITPIKAIENLYCVNTTREQKDGAYVYIMKTKMKLS